MDQDNKKHSFLMERLGVDAISGAVAAFSVAPFVSVIDKAIIENASGRHDLFTSIKLSAKTLFSKPHKFVMKPSFYLVLMVYTGTLATSNICDTLTHYNNDDDSVSIQTQTGTASKFVTTSSVNIGLGLYKDSQFTKLFGTASKARAVPNSTYGLFIIRDVLTIFFSFIVPPLITPLIPNNSFGGISRETVTQMVSPGICQVFSTPFHLLGLDMYNRMNEAGGKQYGWKDRWSIVKKNWGISTLARMGKLVPAFGIGGVVNKKLRDGLLEKVEKLREAELKDRRKASKSL